jgi:hypothetical protein
MSAVPMAAAICYMRPPWTSPARFHASVRTVAAVTNFGTEPQAL